MEAIQRQLYLPKLVLNIYRSNFSEMLSNLQECSDPVIFAPALFSEISWRADGLSQTTHISSQPRGTRELIPSRSLDQSLPQLPRPVRDPSNTEGGRLASMTHRELAGSEGQTPSLMPCPTEKQLKENKGVPAGCHLVPAKVTGVHNPANLKLVIPQQDNTGTPTREGRDSADRLGEETRGTSPAIK